MATGIMLVSTSLPRPVQPNRFTALEWKDRTPGPCRWWNTNLPTRDWSEDCPNFLLGQCVKNVSIMSTLNEDYKLVGWDEAKDIIESKQIDRFGRTPSELRRYIKYTHDLKEKYGSVLYYVQHERLRWPIIEPSGDAPFEIAADYKILYNDWPYALDHHIKHLVVWTKFVIEEEPEVEQLTPAAHEALENFVVRTFCCAGDVEGAPNACGIEGVKRDNLIWFKNWARLRSVHALGEAIMVEMFVILTRVEHFHVLLYNAPKDLLEWATQGDSPVSERLDE